MMNLWIRAAGQAVGEIAPAGSGADALRDRHAMLERRLEKLSLVCQALWTLVRDRTGVTEDDLLRRVEEIDLADGRLDGRIAGVVDCASCGRRYARTRDRCLYCEAPRKGASPFETV